MPFSGTILKRHHHLESFLLRNLREENGWNHVSSVLTHYEPCVISGTDPTHGMGPMPYFAYLVLTEDRLLVVHWPAKNVATLTHLKEVTDIVAVAGISPIFLFNPYKEKAQQIRIYFRESKENCLQDAESKAVDIYLLDPQVTFLKCLKLVWIQQLINSILSVNDTILYSENMLFNGLRCYEWLIQLIHRSSNVEEPKIFITIIYKISTWAKRNPTFRKSMWKDVAIIDWIFVQLQKIVSDSRDNNKKDIVVVLECLASILDNADNAVAWTFLEPRVQLLMDVVVQLGIISGDRNIYSCVAILNSILWLPFINSQTESPAKVMTRSLIQTPNWEQSITEILDFVFALLRSNQQFKPKEIVVLFKTFYVCQRVIDEGSREFLQLMSLQYFEEFRYYVSEGQLSEKFPKQCILKFHILSLGHRLKNLILIM